MNVSTRTEYAVRAMLHLAGADGPCSAAGIAEEQRIPRKFLEAILADLRRAGLVTSQRGAGGGYRLARPADQVPVGAVFRAVDGPLAEVHGVRPHETSYPQDAQHLQTLWVALRVAVREVLDGVSIAQVLEGDFPPLIHRLVAAPDAWENR